MKTASPEHNPDIKIKAYRNVMAQLESAKPAERPALEALAQELRDAWKEWQGEDCLHETAFGEPWWE